MGQSPKYCKVTAKVAAYWYRVAYGHKLRNICWKDSYCIGLYMLGRRRKFEVFTYHAIQVKVSKRT